MLDTPICDFVNDYIASDTSRLHMPGHKGAPFLGPEAIDITEIKGADALYEAGGIIAESEKNASELFGTYRTFYSTEGSSHVIRAMLMLAGQCFPRHDKARRFTVLAARNVHKAFIHALALLDMDVIWLYPEEENSGSICSCRISPKQLEEKLLQCCQSEHPADRDSVPDRSGQGTDAAGSFSACPGLPDAVFITSPDYLGNLADIRDLSEVCARFGLPLLVDNAHGAYLHFLKDPSHPMDLGAAMCCDSAHKTLPVLTGGAYLHIGADPALKVPQIREQLAAGAKDALSLFGSSSPSYLILQSLDLCNRYLSCGYKKRLDDTIQSVDQLKKRISDLGIPVLNTEPLKLVLSLAPSGISGESAAELLRKYKAECEFADAEYVVLMLTPENTKQDFERILAACAELSQLFKKRSGLPGTSADTGNADGKMPANVPASSVLIRLPVLEKACSIREAVFAPAEAVPASKASGRICALPTVSCPPAVPIAVSGERFNDEAVRLLDVYHIRTVSVVKE